MATQDQIDDVTTRLQHLIGEVCPASDRQVADAKLAVILERLTPEAAPAIVREEDAGGQ